VGLRDFTLSDIVEQNARQSPDNTAFEFGDQRVSHAQHLARVQRLAGGLAKAGVGAGDRIAILSHDNLDFVDCYGATAWLGAILVPINKRLSADEIRYIVSDSTPKIVIADDAHQHVFSGGRETFSSVLHWLGIGGTAAPFAPLEEFVGRVDGIARHPVTASAPVVMFHTAAVNGRPRGALISHAGLIASSSQLLHYWSLTRHDVNYGVLPLFHLAGLTMLVAAQHAGGSSIIVPKFDAGEAVRSIRDKRASLLAEFAPILGSLLDIAAGPADLSSLRIVTGLDTPETIERFEKLCPNARFWVAFGQSETSGFVTMALYRDRPGSAGRPTFLNIVAVVDDRDHPLPTGQVGEIVVRGPSVFDGYWNCEADTAATFRNDWHHTGDNGAFDADGYLWYKGRSPAKELIKPGGENVYPAEVEAALAAHPAVLEAVVFGVPDPEWGEAIKSICVLKPGRLATSEELIAFVGGRIARYKRPKYVVFAVGLPKTASGAIDRNQVKDAYRDA
jgi:acyl-CoA synthetase (AMP-forming)/AMP-acid ligase II